jgi:hypothetical protein
MVTPFLTIPEALYVPFMKPLKSSKIKGLRTGKAPAIVEEFDTIRLVRPNRLSFNELPRRRRMLRRCGS